MNSPLKRVVKFITAFSIIGLIANAIFLPAQFIKIHAAENISVDIQAYNSSTEDNTNTSPGLSTPRRTASGYYVQLNNESSTTTLLIPIISLVYPSNSDLNSAGRLCEYVIDDIGLANSSVNFSSPGTCTETFISGSRYEYSISTSLSANKTIYYRISGLEVTGPSGVAFQADVDGAGTFSAGPSVTAGPISAYITPTKGISLTNVSSFSSYGTDSSHVSPGLRVLPGDFIGYYANLDNNSNTTATATYITLQYPTGMDLGTRSCLYVVASTGTVGVDFTGAPACVETPVSGSTYEYSISGSLASGQTIFFKWSGVQTAALSSGTRAAVFSTSGVLAGDQGASIDGPISSYVTTNTGTITGYVFYDNGSDNPTNADDGVSNSGDHLASGIGIYATDGAFTSPTAISDSLGNFTVTVPANDIALFPTSSAYTLTVVLPLGYHVTSSPSTYTNLRVATSSSSVGHAFGINNQTDLQLLTITTTPTGPTYFAHSTVTFHYTVENQSTVTASGISINVDDPIIGTISGSPVASTGTFGSGVWNIPTLVGGASATLDIDVVLGGVGAEQATAEIMSMTSPTLPTTTPASISGDIDSVPGTTSFFLGEDDYQYLPLTVSAEPAITGNVFQDTNNSGDFNSEPGLSGWTVNLYKVSVSTSVPMATITTNSGGNYTFNSTNTVGNVLIENSTEYRITVDPVVGFNVTTSNMPQQFTTAASGNTSASAIGYFSGASITGFAFEDINNDGIRNTLVDQPIAGVTVQLLDSLDAIVATTTTAPILSTPADGKYVFTNLRPDTYRVRMISPTNYVATLQNVGTNMGSDEVNDSDISVINNTTNNLVISFAQTLSDVSGGFFNPSTISGNVFQDLDYNGLDNSEPGFQAVSVTLNNVDTGGVVSMSTDSSGDYHFDNLTPGNYQVEFTAPTNFVFVPYHISGSDLTNDSDVHPESGHTETIVVSNGNDVSAVNAGLANDVADLHLTKTVNPDHANVGDNVTFTLTAHNDGPSATNAVVINDTLPAGVTYVSSNGDGTYTDSNGNWAITTLANGATATLNIVVTITSPGVIVNEAHVVTNPHPDTDTGDNTASTSVTGISLTPSLSVQKSVRLGSGVETSDDTSGPTTFPGTAVSYFIDVVNTSTSALSDLTVGEEFPTVFGVTGWDCGYDVNSTSFLDHTGSYSVSCSIGTLGAVDAAKSLQPGEFLHIRLTGNLAPTTLGTYCNSVRASAQGIDPAESDTACFRVVSPNADLHLTKEVDQNSVNIGDNVVYTLHVINNGPNTSTGAVVNDSLPIGLTFVGSSGDGTYSNSDGDWHVPDLLNGSGATMNITATVTAAGAITNTALITDHLQPDDNTTDNTDDATVTGIAPNPTLAVLKSVQIGADTTETTHNSSGPLVAGNEALTYYVDVANTSLATIANLSVDDAFPTGITGTGWTCSYDVATGALSTHTGSYSTDCTMQGSGHIVLPTSLSPSGVLHIRLTGHTTPMSAGTYCNQVSAVAQGIFTAVTDSACFQVAALAPPVLQITHGSNQTTVTPGSQVTYTITVTNNGGSAATNVLISDNLGDDVNNLVPSCVTSISNVVINNNGVISTNDPTTVLWNIGTLQPGESRTVSIVTTIRSDISSATNCQTTAIASGNNVPSTQAEASISVPVQLGTALVTVNKEVIGSSTVYEPGDTIQYRVTMNNAGNGASSALKLDDALPTNIVRWQSIQSSLGTLIAGANLAVENIILPANSRNVVTYTGVLKDSDTFSLKPWRLDSGADKKDNDFYAEQVVKARILGTSNTDEQSAVGALDQQSVSLGQGGSIILATSKTGKVLVDGDGDDFCLAMPQGGTRYRVSVAQTNQSSSFEKLKTSSKNCFDISSSDLPWIRYIKVEDQSSSGVTSTSLDAVCLLHVGGLLRNTANVLQANSTVATDAEDIAVDFTDVFDDPISASACTAPKQAQVLAPAPLPLPPAPVVIPTPVPVVLPKTGSDTLGLTVILSGLVAMFMFARRKYTLGSKK